MSPLLLPSSVAAGGWIPHQGAMRLIDRLLSASDGQAVAELEVPPDGLFLQDGRMPAWVGIEYLAQTVAAWSTARGRRRGRAEARPGLLLASRHYSALCDGFMAGSRLRIEVRLDWESSQGLAVFDGAILQSGRLLASGRVTVFEAVEGDLFADSKDGSP